MIRRLALSGVVLAIGAAIMVAPAGAVTSSGPRPTLTVRRVDASFAPLVKVDLATGGVPVDPSSFTVREDGTAVKGVLGQRIADAKTPVGTVLVIDTATSMNDHDKMNQVRQLAKGLVQSKAPNDQMAVVAFGGSSRLVQGLTSDVASLNSAIDRLALGGQPALFAGTRIGAGLLVNHPELLGNLVIIGDSGNVVTTDKTATQSTAVGDVLASKAYTFAVGLNFGGASDLSTLSAFASAGRGSYLEATDPSSLTKAFDTMKSFLSTQVELTFNSPSKKAASDLIISTGASQAEAQLVPGTIALGVATNPPAVKVAQAPGPLRGKAGLALIAVLVLGAVGMFAYAMAVLFANDDRNLGAALRPYSEPGTRVSGADEPVEGSLVQSALMQRAVQTTERIANEQGLLVKVEKKLELANLSLRPAEAILFYGVGVVLIGIACLAWKGPIGGLILAAIVAMIPPVVLNTLARMRLRKFNSQLPDTLQLLSSSLRAGFSFMQGVEAVAQESEDPMGSELRRVIVESRLGKPVEDALDDCAARMGSPDFEWAVMAVKIQREVGGNLAELLQTVSTTMVERERLRRDVKSLTAEGRVSGYVLGVLPPGLGIFFYISNPTYMKPLFTQTVGQIALGIAAVSMAIGFAWMNKIVKIEV